jgi:hypothetical protein
VGLAELYGKDTASTALAIEAHRNVLRLEPTRADSLHALFRLWESLRQVDKAFCAAALLVFLKQANDIENAFFSGGRNRLSNELKNPLQVPDLVSLHPLAARHPIVDVLRACGDQFVKLYPPQLEQQGIDRKADRLKNDHAAFKALQLVTNLFGIEEFELYQGKRGLISVETTEPLGVCIGPDVVRRFNLREQRFLYGRAAMSLADKSPIIRKLPINELADVLGNSVRIHHPTFEGLGRKNEDQSKQLRRAYSRKALRLMEESTQACLSAPKIVLEPKGGVATFDFDVPREQKK